MASLSLVVDAAGPALPLRGFYVRNTGDGQIQWHVAASPPVDWLSISTETGVATGLYSPPVAITIDAASLAAGVYTTTLSISGQAGSLNSPLAIPVTLWVGPAENTHLPMLFK